MRASAVRLLLLLCAWFSFPALSEEGSPITFEQAYRASLERTETISIQESISQQREENVKQAVGTLFPVVNFSADYLLRDNGAVTPGGIKASGWNWGVGLNQPVFDGFQRVASIRGAKREWEAQKKLTDQARLDLFARVAEVHYTVLASEKDVLHLRNLLGLTDRRAKELRERVRIGRSRSSELLTTEAQAAVLKSQIREAQGLVSRARSRFEEITGLPAGSRLDESGLPLPQKLQEVSFYLAQTEQRPDLQVLQARALAAEENVTIARSAHFPQVSLFGNYYFNRTGTYSGSNWDLGTQLVLPIFQGGVIQSRVRESAEQARQRELELASLKRRAASQVEVSYSILSADLERIEALTGALKLLELNYQEQQRDYRFGQANNLDVLQALNSLLDARRELDRTRYQGLISYAALLAATGRNEP